MLTTIENTTRVQHPGPADLGGRRTPCPRSSWFDPTVLHSVGVEDPRLMEEVLMAYLMVSTDLLRDMFHQQRVGDARGLADGAAHLREVAEAVGAGRLAEQCRVLEQCVDQPLGIEREVEELFSLDRELDRSQNAIRVHLQGWIV